MSAKKKCFWLEAAAWGLLVLCVAAEGPLEDFFGYGSGKWLSVLALAPAWVVSLFAYNAWTGIPREERDRMDSLYRRAHLHKLTPKYIVGFLPVMCPLMAVCRAVL